MNFIPIAHAERIISARSKPIEQVALNIISNIILPLIGAIAVGMVIYGGVLFITSSGDPEKVTKARKTLMWAIIGIIIVVLSYAIVVSLSKLIVKAV